MTSQFVQPPLAGQVRLGRDYTEDPSTDYWFNRVHEDGAAVAAEVSGWGNLDAITPLDQVGGRDGAMSGPTSFAPKMLTVGGLVTAPTAAVLADHFARLRRLLVPPGRNTPRVPIVLEMYDHAAGRRLAVLVRPSGRQVLQPVPGSQVGGEAGVLDLALVAANPVWKLASGDLERASVGLLDPSLLGGRTYSKVYPYGYGGGGDPGGQLVALNAGDREAAPTYYLTGPADYPIVQNVTSGEEWAVNAVIPAGVTVRVETRSGNVQPENVRLAGRPFYLEPGANTIRWRTLSGTYSAAALLALEWRSTYA